MERSQQQRARRGRAAATAVVLALACAALGPAAHASAPTAPTATGPATTIEDRTPATSPAPAGLVASAGLPEEEVHAADDEPMVVARETDLAPFSLIGIGLAAPAEPAMVRVRQGGTWGPWQALHFSDDHGPDGESATIASGRRNSEPVWVGPSDGYEVAVPADAGAPVVHLAHDGTGPASAGGGEVSAAATAFDFSPGVRPRTSWGARPMTQTPVESSGDLRLAVVHHSVTTNSYSPADVPGILRGIQAYHMDSNRWSDIGYNFAVDRFGGIWEARQGGIVRPIVGGHAAGFNTTSVGVVLLGDFSTASPPQAMLAATAEIIGWRFAVAEVEPSGTIQFTTSTGSTKFPPGSTVELDRISGHRDVGLTGCPGNTVYAQLPNIRAMAVNRYRAYAGNVPTRWLNSPTHRYTDLRGETPNGVEVTATAAGAVEAAVRGLDDRLWTTRWNGSQWVPWQPVEGVLRSAPALVPQTGGGVLAFVVGGDGGLYVRTRTGAATWSGWTSLGGVLTSPIDAVRTADGSVVVVGRGLDGGIWGRSRTVAGTWGAWFALGGRVPENTGPAVASVANGRLDVLAHGLDDAIWVRSMSTNLLGGTSWTGWSWVGGRVTGSPAATGGAAADALDLVVRGGDGRLYATRRVGTGWSGWTQISRQLVGTEIGVHSWGTGRIDVGATTPDGRAFQTWWSPSGGW